MRKKFCMQVPWLLLLSILCTVAAHGQSITGTVSSSDDGKALEGVTVQVKGKSNGTRSDAAGAYTIQAARGDVLLFSFAGYTQQEFLVGEATVIDIVLRVENNNMGEVVVIGYGTQSRRNVTSSVGKLDNTILRSAPRANVGTALQGSLAGLRVINNTGSPGATPAIQLRGGASINNPGAPLVVIDGIIRPFNDVPPEDIASIEILRDAAATAIYGARANNGVILITTKQGKAGKAEVSYRYIIAFNKEREDYEYLGTRDYIQFSRQGHLNSQRTLAQANSQNGFGLQTSPAFLATFDIRRYEPSLAGLLSAGWDTVGDPYGGTIIFKDHAGEVRDLVFRNTTTHDHYVSVIGGNDRGKYFSSFNYYDEDGVVVGSGYKRYSGTLNGSYNVTSKLEIGSGATFSNSTTLGLLGGDVNTLYRNISLWPTFNPWLDSAKTRPNPGNGLTDGNPLYWLDKNYRNNSVNRFTANAFAKYDFSKSFYVRASGNMYLFEATNETFTKATQTFTQVFANVFNANRPATWGQSKTFQKQFNGIANYSETFGDKHNVGAMLGVEYFSQRNTNAQLAGSGAPTDDIRTVNASTIFTPGANFTNQTEFTILSQFGRFTYDYDQRYLLSLVVRRDGISSLAEENRWGFFPGMSAGWNVHREKFFKNSGLSKFVSALKPRISYGENGNVAGIGEYEVQGVYGSQGNYNGRLGFLNTAVPNSGLQWEKSKTTNVGLDLGLFGNRVTVIFDYYDRRTTDLLTNLSLPSYTGYASVRTNLGTLQNRGTELTINANVLRTSSGFSLDLGGNISFNKNKILELPFNGNENNRQGGFQIYDPKQGRVVWVGGLQEGQALGDVYAFQQLSIFQNEAEVQRIAGNRYDAVANISGPNLTIGAGKITPGDVNWFDVDANDTIDTRDQVYMGNTNPKYFGGFTTMLTYKGWSLFTRWDFAGGHILYNHFVARVLGNYQGTFNNLDLIKRGFSGDNSRPDIPKVYWADQVGAPNGKKNLTRANNAAAVVNGNNSNFYERGDYLACREITLSYDFSRNLLSKTKILSQARMYLNLNNMFYFSKFSGNSPEPKDSGIFDGNYAVPRTYALGIQVTF
jgi:TonB-linked SusC/RagA family outer membrane protein